MCFFQQTCKHFLADTQNKTMNLSLIQVILWVINAERYAGCRCSLLCAHYQQLLAFTATLPTDGNASQWACFLSGTHIHKHFHTLLMFPLLLFFSNGTSCRNNSWTNTTQSTNINWYVSGISLQTEACSLPLFCVNVHVFKYE